MEEEITITSVEATKRLDAMVNLSWMIPLLLSPNREIFNVVDDTEPWEKIT